MCRSGKELLTGLNTHWSPALLEVCHLMQRLHEVGMAAVIFEVWRLRLRVQVSLSRSHG